jgi:hypothetical protein
MKINEDIVKNFNSNKLNSNSDSNLIENKILTKGQRYYNRHSKRINKDRRKNYKLIKTNQKKNDKNKVKKLKPKTIFKPFFPSENSEICLSNLENKGLRYGLVDKIKAIMGFNELLEFSSECLSKDECITNNSGTKPTSFFDRPEIVFYVADFKQRSYSEIEDHFKSKLSSKQVKRSLQLLVNLKWLVRENRADLTSYRVNPFLEALKDLDEQYLTLCFYTKLEIDFFDLLNVPLINAVRSGKKIVNAKVEFDKFEMGSHAQWVRAFFEGLVHLELHTETGTYETYLPVNKHASSKIIGYDHTSKKPITSNQFYHHTIPLRWSLFDILESSEFGKNCTYIHFDNSFKIIAYQDNKKDAYGYYQDLMFRKPFEKIFEIKKGCWSTENCQYIEVSDFETLQKLFTYRFVDEKRRSKLFDSLGISYKSKEHLPKNHKIGRPKGSKNKPKIA